MLKLMKAPAKYVQGKDALLELYDNIKDLGNSFLFVCSGSGRKHTEDKIRKSFEGHDSQIFFETFGGISCTGEIQRIQKIAKENNVDVICGVGGGNAIDTAKASAYYSHLPVVVIPTICATDAPCTALSVIYNDDGTFGSYLFYPASPNVVLVDTSVIVNAPVRFLVAGMGDALGTYFEARTCETNNAPSLENGGVTKSAMALCKLCWETLLENGVKAKVAVNAGLLTPAVENIVEATTYLSGVGADNGGLAAAHSIYNGFTALDECEKTMHGEIVAYGTLTQLLLENAPLEEFKKVHDFCKSVGLPVTLSQLGISNTERLHIAAQKACSPGESIHNLTKPVTPCDLYNCLVAVDHMNSVLE